MSVTVSTLTAPAAGQGQREWLSTQTDDAGKALAIFPSRGRFSGDAKVALAHAESQGWAFAEPVKATPTPAATPKAAPATPAAPRVSAPRPVPAPPVPVAATASINAKEVRSWAKANGHAVGARGRINPVVIAAYVKANGAPTGPRARVATPLDMPKRRSETKGYAVHGSHLISQTICGARSCGAAVSRCNCKGGPQSFMLDGRQVPLTLVKPSL